MQSRCDPDLRTARLSLLTGFDLSAGRILDNGRTTRRSKMMSTDGGPMSGFTAAQWSRPVRSAEELREILGEPSTIAKHKVLAALNEHCREFIARSPFAM